MNGPTRLTLGPVLFHWKPEKTRDFYYRIADEADIDCVYVGEVICSKRDALFAPYVEDVLYRLVTAGKQVVHSTLAVMTSDREVAAARRVGASGALVEANDVASLQAVAGHPHVIGPYINVFNEDTHDLLAKGGAVRIVLPVEISGGSVAILAGRGTDTELLVFGRQPLSVAMRCYHARSHGLTKDTCQFVCGLDPDGLPVDTIDGQRFLTVNGTQTLSSGYLVQLRNLTALRAMGVTHFRLSPQDIDMVRVARIHRAVLAGDQEPLQAEAALRELTGPTPWQNGFLHGREGSAWVEAPLSESLTPCDIKIIGCSPRCSPGI